MFKELLSKCLNGETLSAVEAQELMNDIMNGQVPPTQIAGILTLLTYRGETVEEIVGFVKGMRNNMNTISIRYENVIDTCGTGGDGASTFNISTASAIVASAAGVKVAKHGNRAVSSKSGSADVLERLGVDIQGEKTEVEEALERVNMSFLFAPLYHPAMKHVAQTRRELGFRTVFNALGPLANPTNCSKQVIGVYSIDLARKLAQALVQLKAKHVLLVCGRDGLDEISVTTETDVVEVKDGRVVEYMLSPESLGVQRGTMKELIVNDAAESAALIQSIFKNGENKIAQSAVAVNAAAAIYVSGAVQTLEQGVVEAMRIIESGQAFEQLQRLKSEEVVNRA
ncbi:anthranilate phosphoribosyltransferase [Priestia flexa]|uniref:Anthranilate phosphoribosyltransferase n=1 Tax=Priestia flexa TaxID=86664 RepID=A0ABU4J991_9BACI|nr:anthranilate phosphoribosyltransferase [Priestia flexa]AQX53918.1 anthranilate phosphoribosyltransferase [Priestia flexa]MCA1200459.1 anthranilate phosphoribosyltransferase [Priestia flexa]MCG7312061.1 anthranilate phosphoribosyltransferase [Priestia flexa]MDW8517549.1 anthranilate phosphoribosyltransferase [Priestia flexa]MEC0666353.1 anthranilate phosphoribosyltransferase [Priestia flexa]